MAHIIFTIYGLFGAVLAATLGLLVWAAGKDGERQRLAEQEQ
jgi:hypothetical protein